MEGRIDKQTREERVKLEGDVMTIVLGDFFLLPLNSIDVTGEMS